ncbi:MAG TPA: orotidine-5'-phosphate decarboxylase [Blastocatellia bacterium]|nr:orotidine-5'-phosphate decarboxylase [Blastocatellia bacterium]
MASTTEGLSVKDRLVVALDVADRANALRLIERLSGAVGMFKIGLQLFTAEGASFVREVTKAGERVFLDLKYHDIPNTVAGAARSALSLGVTIFNVHTLGGAEMMRAAARSVRGSEYVSGVSDDSAVSTSRPIVLGVTVLTSMDEADLAEVGINSGAGDTVIRLARLARESGLDGVVASPQEIRSIRERVADRDFVILTPGIRPAWSGADDQKRIATPERAIRDGADFLVIGRAITSSDDPRAAAERILEEIDRAV